MKSFTSTILLLAGLTTANPITQSQPRQTTPSPYQISTFYASRTHNSYSCNYEFTLTSSTLPTPITCSARGLDSGFTGSPWLASVYPGTGNCNDTRVTWEFYQPKRFDGETPADFYVTIDGVKGKYVIPKEDFTLTPNGPSPFDDDFYYSGPQEFEVVDFDF
ncbi:hypothetical protein QBC38DRAFT_362671 [Podospora fimiseda]|uniref:Ubiquitin 3 binding protein But2 C-terminal domain-containing protein n=1 Tax=Podospora fimiseda TaxID=252190 RepID=A0AAN7BRH7_9PEZI|nr:hypothetical protein QBC38DRAFT_362671 [Podospora fimiseda]